MRYTPYSQEERQFLRDNISDCGSFAELTRLLNAAFGSNRKMESVREQCNKRLHLKNGKNDGQYGKRSRTQLPVGTIRKSNNGTTYIKVADAAGQCTTGYREPAWIPLQKKYIKMRTVPYRMDIWLFSLIATTMILGQKIFTQSRGKRQPGLLKMAGIPKIQN